MRRNNSKSTYKKPRAVLHNPIGLSIKMRNNGSKCRVHRGEDSINYKRLKDKIVRKSQKTDKQIHRGKVIDTNYSTTDLTP